MTILLTTHYSEEADRLAAGLAIVDRGRVVVEGSPDELKAQLLPALLGALDAHGVAVSSAKFARPSLDDVYLRHAGRAFGDAERAAAARRGANDGRHPCRRSSSRSSR